jgi:Ca-activated chloride channel family protein
MVRLQCRVNRDYVRAERKNTIFVSAEVQAEETPAEAAPVHMCLAVDCSASMEGEKIEMAKEAAIRFIQQLRPQDYVSVVRFASSADVLVSKRPAVEKDEIIDRVTNLKLGTLTALYDAVKLSLEQLSAPLRGYNRRLLLLTDGEPTTGPTDIDTFVELAKHLRSEGMSLSALGIGEEYNEDLLLAMAQAADGKWYHISHAAELPRVFVQELNDARTVLLVRPQLHVRLLSGAELSNIYRVGSMVMEVTDYERTDDEVVLTLEDIRAESTYKTVFKLHIPPKPEGEWRVAELTLRAPQTELTEKVSVKSTSNPELWGKETDPYPRALLTLAQATVLSRQAVEDATLVKPAQGLIETIMKDPDAATAVRRDPSLMALGNTVVRVAETVVRGGLSKEDRKKLKYDATVVRR